MRWPPRITPSERPDGLAQLYSLMYPQGQYAIAIDAAYRQQRARGLAFAHVWISRGACPHAVESTAGIIQAQQLDEQLLGETAVQGAGDGQARVASMTAAACEWPVRSMYAMGMVRFVNAVADEHQNGLYAQSIFSIAQRISLPVWFVELRHAATHEELPSLDVLRQASVAALAWLQARFWLPSTARLQAAEGSLLGMSAEQGDVFENSLSEQADCIRDSLLSYKRLAKQVAQDASLRGPSRNAIKQTHLTILRVATRAAKSLAAQLLSSPEAASFASSEGLCNASSLLAEVLVEPGFLVPEAKSKRPRPGQGHCVAPLSPALQSTWIPLLVYLDSSLYDFSSALLQTLLDRIQAPLSEGSKQRGSYLSTLASWLFRLYAGSEPVFSLHLPNQSLQREKEEDEIPYRNTALGTRKSSFDSLHLARQCLSHPSSISLAIVRQMCADDEDVAQRIEPLLELVVPADEGTPSKRTSIELEPSSGVNRILSGDDRADSMAEMERAVQAMEAQLATLSEASANHTSSHASSTLRPSENDDEENTAGLARKRQKIQQKERRQADAKVVCQHLPGWRLADPTTFQPTPLGCLRGAVPDLILREEKE